MFIVASPILGCLRPGAQHFGNTPGLRNAAAGVVRLSGIEHFADRADPRFAQMFWKPREKFTRRGSIVRMDFQPRVDERPDQPRPNRALMVGAIARAQIASVNRFVFRIVWRERAQTERREQFFFHNVDDRLPTFRIEDRMVNRDGQQLIWSQ